MHMLWAFDLRLKLRLRDPYGKDTCQAQQSLNQRLCIILAPKPQTTLSYFGWKHVEKRKFERKTLTCYLITILFNARKTMAKKYDFKKSCKNLWERTVEEAIECCYVEGHSAFIWNSCIWTWFFFILLTWLKLLLGQNVVFWWSTFVLFCGNYNWANCNSWKIYTNTVSFQTSNYAERQEQKQCISQHLLNILVYAWTAQMFPLLRNVPTLVVCADKVGWEATGGTVDCLQWSIEHVLKPGPCSQDDNNLEFSMTFTRVWKVGQSRWKKKI